ncbi:DUF6671 family protein [Pseudomonas sp. LP_7_YM]|uniref:DUF6671 family protein n=1 Tax=Pseudomonas sp. LP_7_YM TaxID=2485137 RepID=UPI00105D557C|nr:DUF6671 family protein [Pseudomonas sp. LP_7_YM]TDV60825.1 hypothetical protein EC915_11070 [Pseudomonas sp. LP_7_YM]
MTSAFLSTSASSAIDPAQSPAVLVQKVAGSETGLPVLIATMHGKEAVLGPTLAALGFQVMLPIGYDTDALGTFSGDVRRPGTAFEAALEKARRACDATGVARAVSSEGTYRPSQALFPGARNAELLAFVDRETGFECVEYVTDTPTRFDKGRVPPDINAPEVQALLRTIGWPQIKVLVVPQDPGEGVVMPEWVFKGIGNERELAEAFDVCASYSTDGWVHLETDLRAHMNPSRMASIATVGERLALRLAAQGYRSDPFRLSR